MIERYVSKQSFKVGARIKDDQGNRFEVVSSQPLFLTDSSRRDFGLTVINLGKEFMSEFDSLLKDELEKRERN